MIAILLMCLVCQDAEPHGSSFGVLIRGAGSADIRQGFSTLLCDTLTAFPKAEYEDRLFKLHAMFSADFQSDTAAVAFKPVSAGGFFRWPGSPWLSAGVFRGMKEPFIQGLDKPVVEWNSTEALELTGVAAEAGGVLGFDGFWNQYGDSLSWYGIRSPWMGFGMVYWNRLENQVENVETVSGFLDLRRVQPWVIMTGRGDLWTTDIELRGLMPVRLPSSSIELVPSLSLCNDSTIVSLGGYLRGRTGSYSGYLTGSANTGQPEEASLKAGFDMLSRAGVDWSLMTGLHRMEDFSGTLSGHYRAAPAGFGGSLFLADDSLAVTLSALYSPLRGVSSILSVTTDLSTGSPDPRCVFGVHGRGSSGMAGFTVEWEEGVTELRLGVSAWID